MPSIFIVAILVLIWSITGDDSFLLFAFVLAVLSTVYMFIADELKTYDDETANQCKIHDWDKDELGLFCKKCRHRP